MIDVLIGEVNIWPIPESPLREAEMKLEYASYVAERFVELTGYHKFVEITKETTGKGIERALLQYIEQCDYVELENWFKEDTQAQPKTTPRHQIEIH